MTAKRGKQNGRERFPDGLPWYARGRNRTTMRELFVTNNGYLYGFIPTNIRHRRYLERLVCSRRVTQLMYLSSPLHDGSDGVESLFSRRKIAILRNRRRTSKLLLLLLQRLTLFFAPKSF